MTIRLPWKKKPATTDDILVAACRFARAARRKGMDPIWIHAKVMRTLEPYIAAPEFRDTMWRLIKALAAGPEYTDDQIREALREVTR